MKCCLSLINNQRFSFSPPTASLIQSDLYELDKEGPTAHGSALCQVFLLEDVETSKLNCCLMQPPMSLKKKGLQAKSHSKK